MYSISWKMQKMIITMLKRTESIFMEKVLFLCPSYYTEIETVEDRGVAR